MERIFLAALLLVASMPLTATAQSEIDGTYELTSPYCTDVMSGEDLCTRAKDCLSLERRDEIRVWFSVRSIQLNLHLCEATGTATRISRSKNEEVFEYRGEGFARGRSVMIHIRPNEIQFFSDNNNHPLCGARADWYLVHFPLTSRKTKKIAKCRPVKWY